MNFLRYTAHRSRDASWISTAAATYTQALVRIGPCSDEFCPQRRAPDIQRQSIEINTNLISEGAQRRRATRGPDNHEYPSKRDTLFPLNQPPNRTVRGNTACVRGSTTYVSGSRRHLRGKNQKPGLKEYG